MGALINTFVAGATGRQQRWGWGGLLPQARTALVQGKVPICESNAGKSCCKMLKQTIDFDGILLCCTVLKLVTSRTKEAIFT